MHRGGRGRGAPGKMSRESGAVVESVRGQAGGETMQTHMTMEDQRWVEHAKRYSRSLSGRGKKEKEKDGRKEKGNSQKERMRREEERRGVKGQSEVFGLNDWNNGIAIHRNRKIVCRDVFLKARIKF